MYLFDHDCSSNQIGANHKIRYTSLQFEHRQISLAGFQKIGSHGKTCVHTNPIPIPIRDGKDSLRYLQFKMKGRVMSHDIAHAMNVNISDQNVQFYSNYSCCVH